MFEKKSDKELTIIYAIIAIFAALGLAALHYIQGLHPYYIIIAANIEFFCIFYIFYLPIKVKKEREKQKNSKKK